MGLCFIRSRAKGKLLQFAILLLATLIAVFGLWHTRAKAGRIGRARFYRVATWGVLLGPIGVGAVSEASVKVCPALQNSVPLVLSVPTHHWNECPGVRAWAASARLRW